MGFFSQIMCEAHQEDEERRSYQRYIEYLLDILLYGSDAERAALIKQQARSISVLERRFSTEGFKKGT